MLEPAVFPSRLETASTDARISCTVWDAKESCAAIRLFSDGTAASAVWAGFKRR